MRKLLRPSDRILLALAFLGDFWEEFKDPLGEMAATYEVLYGWVPLRYQRSNYVRMLGRSLKTGNLEKVVKGDQVCLRLTGESRKRLARDFPLIVLQGKKWDGKWRIVIFDIEEKQRKFRDRLRAKLRELGFGMIQESVWLTPFDIVADLREFLATIGLGSQTFVLVAERDLGGFEKDLAAKIWRLEELNQEYRELLEIWEDRSGGEVKKLVKELRQRYLEILVKDPLLPKELLPSDWLGERARKLVKTLS